MIYDFDNKLKEGEGYEVLLDAYFEDKGYDVSPVTMGEQKRGIDRYWTCGDGIRWSVEYKADSTAGETGNMFLETVSVDTESSPGWVLKSTAQLLVYYIPPSRRGYVMEMAPLKRLLRSRREDCEVQKVQNRHYRTHGIVVPIEEAVQGIHHCTFRIEKIPSLENQPGAKCGTGCHPSR